MDIDEITCAVAPHLTETDLAPFELKVCGPDGITATYPVRHTAQTIVIQSDQRWSMVARGQSVHFQRQEGQALLRWGTVEASLAELEPGQRAELLDHVLWLVDTRSPFLGVLECYSGEFQGQTWSLGYQPYRVGRRGSARSNEIELNHPTISRAHATFYPAEGGRVFVLAESTSSPVLINAQPLPAQQSIGLKGGDSLQLGELLFRFRQLQASAPTSYFPNDGSLPPYIGRYTITGRLGNGGMGVVYAGVDAQRGEVAIKVPLPHLLNDPEFIRRFNREMKLGAGLRHPRLTRIWHFEPAGGSQYPYLVMEKLSGQPLDQVSAPIPRAQALRWTAQLLEGLQFLHQNGVIHRDLKPANLFVTDTGLKIADLGIAHFSGTVGERATQTGTILGTAVYLDPAMLRGESADHRSDLYAAGLLLYEWTVGQLPYPSEPLQIFRMKLSEDLPPISDVRPDLPLEFCAFVDRLTHPDPNARFADAGAALQALAPLLAAGG
ncbi:protein kinase [bacterium]|nr:protein kinase [bacterium]